MNTKLGRVILFLVSLLGAMSVQAAQAVPQVPQIPAFLPMAHTVPQTAKLPIDGEWVISAIGKRVRIQSGRAFAVDPWVHMFVLQIQPMMVVIKDIQAAGGNQYSGSDLPLMGAWQAQLGADGTLNVSVQGVFGPVRYAMMPLSMDDQSAFESAKRGEVLEQPVTPDLPDELPDEEDIASRPDPDEPPADDDEDWDW